MHCDFVGLRRIVSVICRKDASEYFIITRHFSKCARRTESLNFKHFLYTSVRLSCHVSAPVVGSTIQFLVQQAAFEWILDCILQVALILFIALFLKMCFSQHSQRSA